MDWLTVSENGYLKLKCGKAFESLSADLKVFEDRRVT